VQNIIIWITFGIGKHFSYMHIKCWLSLYSTGCDTTFYGRGKKSAWEVWKCFNDVTEAFTYMASCPFAVLRLDCPQVQLLEHFTVILL